MGKTSEEAHDKFKEPADLVSITGQNKMPDFLTKLKTLNDMAKASKVENKKSYAPKGRYLWDSWMLKDEQNGKPLYRLFHLDAPDNGDPESRHKNARIRQAISTDMKSWQDVGPAINTGEKGTWDEGNAMWTGNVYKKDNGEYMFLYTAADKEDDMLFQRVGLARSKDGVKWEKEDKPFLEPDGKYYETTEKDSPIVRAWRDPTIVKDEENGKYNMYITAKTKDGDPTYRGCIALATADEIDGKYEAQPPVIAPGYYAQMEVPQVIQKNGKVYMFFSSMEKDYNPEWAEKIGGPQTGLHCFVGDSLKGPFKPLNGNGVVTGSKDNLYTVKLMPDPKRDGEYVATGWYMEDKPGQKAMTLSQPMKVDWEGDNIKIDTQSV